MITFEALRDVAQQEKKSQKPVSLPANFFDEVKAYLAQDLPALEEESAKIQLEEILEMRDKKILNLAFYNVRSGVEPEHLTKEEEKLYTAVVEAIRTYTKNRKQLIEGPPEETKVVAFLKDVPAFVGENLQQYGPFAKGDVVTIPVPEATLLVEKKVGKLISTDR